MTLPSGSSILIPHKKTAPADLSIGQSAVCRRPRCRGRG
jgi:hypothetical protein